jgi:SpoVK/Ycf46/Vps4 family AAA+-type ATPase
LAGYESQKRDIEDTVLLALSYPSIYDNITEGTRVFPEKNRPKAVLFEGPPGTGKTTSAKIIANQV